MIYMTNYNLLFYKLCINLINNTHSNLIISNLETKSVFDIFLKPIKRRIKELFIERQKFIVHKSLSCNIIQVAHLLYIYILFFLILLLFNVYYRNKKPVLSQITKDLGGTWIVLCKELPFEG